MNLSNIVEVVKDSGWNVEEATSNRRRGITDYVRKIEFKTNPTNAEMSKILDFLVNNKCPGWTGVSVRLSNKEKNEWSFFTTMDSSD